MRNLAIAMIAAAGLAATPALAQDQQTEGTPPAEQAEPAPAPESSTDTPTDASKEAADDSNGAPTTDTRSEEHTSELQSLMRISYAVFCLKKKTTHTPQTTHHTKHIMNNRK